MEKIKLIGIRGEEKYEFWRKTLIQSLHNLNIKTQFEEVNNIESILNYSLNAIPALVLGDIVLMEQNNHLPDVDEMISYITKYQNKLRSLPK